MVASPSAPATPVPEFMWCQRSDRVYVTVKVADCQDASVDVSSDHKLTFRGRGSGMCGQRDYALSIDLAKPVVKAECRWFVCGPSVRVRLQKMECGPYWAALMPKGIKMAQCKVDWQSWLDEDEESEVSAAPNGVRRSKGSRACSRRRERRARRATAPLDHQHRPLRM